MSQASPNSPSSPRARLWVLTAPSGAGKTTLVHALLARRPNLVFSVSCTTRPPRPGEMDGRDYFFVTPEQFRRKVEEHRLLEHAEVFGNCYGTDRAHVERELARGHDVLLEIDWQGARQVRSRMPEARLVFIMPPSIEELARRLHGRGTDSAEVIARRLAAAREDIARWRVFDYVIVNDDFSRALDQLCSLLDGRNEETAAVVNAELRKRLEAIAEGS